MTARYTSKSLPAKTVTSEAMSAREKDYPRIIGRAGTAPSSAQAQLAGAKLRVTVSAKKSGGTPEGAPMSSRAEVDGTRISLVSGTHTYSITVSPGDSGKLRVLSSNAISNLVVKVVGYTRVNY